MAIHFVFSPRIRSFLLSLGVVLGGPAWGADPGLSPGTVTFVPFNSGWKYEDTGTDLGTAWRQPDYVDALWRSGVAQLGYGDGDESAVVGFGPDANAKYITTYFRRQFLIAEAASITGLRGRLLQDDGAVVYVNGVEISRSNLPMGPIAFHTLASSVSPDNQILGFSAPASVLVEGVNVIAVEMHQVNPVSSDLSFDLELVGDVQPVPVNQPPVVQLTAPLDGQVFDAPADVRLAATTTDPDGYADTVEFFANDQKIGEAQVVFIQAPPPGEPIHFEFVWRNAPVGDHRLTAKTRDNDGATANSDPIHVTVRDLPSGDRELHAIGIYSGAVGDGGSSRNHEPGEAFVLVNRPGKRVTLFLTAYEPVFWDITLGAGTTIERVFLSGYYRQEVLWLAPDVPVVATSYEQANGYTYLGYTLDSGRFLQALPEVCALTGMDISSFHGSYTAPHLTPIVIDGVQNDERLRCDYPQPVDPSQLPALDFRLTFYDGQIFTRDYTLAGPVNGGKLLPAMRVVADGAQRYYYGTDGPGQRQATRVDALSGAAEPIVFTPVPEDQGWEMGAAFDSRRDRVLLVTLGGQGFLYGLASNDTEWSRLASMNNLDLDCLEYHPPGDALYGVEISRVDSRPPAILEFGPDGSFRRKIPLPSFPFNISPAWHRSELVSVGDYLVLLLEPEYFNVNQPLDSRIYLIDPRSGQVWLTYRRQGIPPVPNPDTDGDGVPNDRDRCPGTSAGSVVNADGCSLAQLCPCDGPWRNHAEYVVCAIRHAWEFYRQDLISADQRRAIILDAVRSNCGRRLSAPEPPQLHTLPLTAEECRRDGFQFVLSGDVPPDCAMESSTDLIHWSPFTAAETLRPGSEITCPGGSDAPMRFYRLRLGP